MENLIKVQCISCEGKYYAEWSDVPDDVEPDVAFPCKCPLCDEGEYAVLSARETKKHK